MSKMDGLRAMREARYAAATRTAAATKTTKTTTSKASPKATPKVTRAEPTSAETDAAQPEDDLCGHRNMSGRTCTRERGHAAKSHRYS